MRLVAVGAVKAMAGVEAGSAGRPAGVAMGAGAETGHCTQRGRSGEVVLCPHTSN